MIVGPAIHIQRIKIYKISSLCSLWSEGFLGIAIYSLRGRCRTLRVIFVEVDVVAKHQNRNHRSVASVLLLGSGSYSGAAAATDWYGWWCATMLPMMRAVRVAPLQAAAWQVRIPLGACELTTPRLLFTDQDAGVEGFEVGGLLRTGASTGSCAGGGEHTGTAPPRALGLHACLDHRSLPHFTNPCHLSAHRCWPRVEDIHLSPQLAPRVLQRFITGAVHPRQLQCGYGPQGPEVVISAAANIVTSAAVSAVTSATTNVDQLGAAQLHPPRNSSKSTSSPASTICAEDLERQNWTSSSARTAEP
ncbi:hypothetical protein CYMTET_28373 [Cymbomonas tetramitiformis]|uniref:Uncharacterized protein n=1 Tax=Cymbomonas tetramitiformis TaxID=36881 RepID=A0AAE0KWA9_9CHLO|nr:hypothetical protein CYMTET_28373 [Cymbomonas tetramitiformis]